MKTLDKTFVVKYPSNGPIYKGELNHKNIRNGFGVCDWPNGDSYQGQWSNGLFHQFGTYTYKDGRKYIGEWNQGKKNGFGLFIWADGKKYEG